MRSTYLWTWALFSVAIGGPSVAAQDSAFVVLSPIQQGPAAILIDGRPRGSLGVEEVTLSVTPGQHTLTVRKGGFADFQRQFVVAAGDVQQLEVRLRPVVAAIVEDKAETGEVRQGAGRFRVVHLEPVKTVIAIGGVPLGETPATISVPSGEHEIMIGGYSGCWIVAPNDSGYIRVRNGVLEQINGINRCDRRPIPVALHGIPRGVAAALNDDPIPLGESAPGVAATLINGPGTYVLTLGGPYVPLELEMDVRWGDSVTVIVDMGSLPPALRGDTLPPPRPTPSFLEDYRYPVAPTPPDTSGLPAMLRDLDKCRRQGRAGGRGAAGPVSCRAFEEPVDALRTSVATYRGRRIIYQRQVLAIDSLNAGLNLQRDSLAKVDAALLTQWQVADSMAAAAKTENSARLEGWRMSVRVTRKTPIIRIVRRPMD